MSVPLCRLAFLLFHCLASKCPPGKSPTADWWQVVPRTAARPLPHSPLISTISLTANDLLSTSTARSPSVTANSSNIVALICICGQIIEKCIMYPGATYRIVSLCWTLKDKYKSGRITVQYWEVFFSTCRFLTEFNSDITNVCPDTLSCPYLSVSPNLLKQWWLLHLYSSDKWD